MNIMQVGGISRHDLCRCVSVQHIPAESGAEKALLQSHPDWRGCWLHTACSCDRQALGKSGLQHHPLGLLSIADVPFIRVQLSRSMHSCSECVLLMRVPSMSLRKDCPEHWHSRSLSPVWSAGLNRTLGIKDKVFVLVDSVLLTGLGRIALMPTLVLAAKVCPEVRWLLQRAQQEVVSCMHATVLNCSQAVLKRLKNTDHPYSSSR